jgi:FkbM family methyltransferase
VLTGQYAPQETRLVREWLRPGATFVDVGANWGYFALLAAERVGPAGRVVALEPDARVFARLEENVARNRLGGVLPLALAAAEGPGTARLARYAEGSGNRGVSSLQLPGDGVAVATDALDAVLDRAGVDVADLVKIDVEGAESRVVQGMRDGLARGRYRRVMIELHPGIVPGVTAAVSGLMRAAGYAGYWVDHSPEATRRAAYGRAGPGEALTPVDDAAADERWPHQVWLAPGVTR